MTRNQILALLAAVAVVAFLAARMGAGTTAHAAPTPAIVYQYGGGYQAPAYQMPSYGQQTNSSDDALKRLQQLQNTLNPTYPPSQDQTCRQLGYGGANFGAPGCR